MIMALMIKADYDPVKAGRRLNVGRHDMMNAVKAVNDGTAVGYIVTATKKVPVLLHTDVKDSRDMESVEDLPIWNGHSARWGRWPTASVHEYPLVRIRPEAFHGCPVRRKVGTYHERSSL